MAVRNRTAAAADDKPKDNGKTGKEKQSPFSGRFNPRLAVRPERGADHTLLSHTWWARLVLFAGGAAIAIYTVSKHQAVRVSPMARHDETLDTKRYQNLLCAPAFRNEIEALGNPDCLPAKCGRVVQDGLVSEVEAHALLDVAKKGLAKGGSSGGASILDLHSGALSQGEHFINLYKVYPDLFTKQDFTLYKTIKNRVKAAVAEHFGVRDEAMFLTHPTFFSRINNAEAKTLHDEYWHLHIDKETYPNFHYTSLLYLTDKGVDFSGGTFVFVDSYDKLNRTIDPRVGRVSAFTSGIENKHYVEPVTEGIRYALTMGFTCDQSKAIPDPGLEHEE